MTVQSVRPRRCVSTAAALSTELDSNSNCRIRDTIGHSPTGAEAPLPVDTGLVSVLVRALEAGGGGVVVLLGGGGTVELPAATKTPF